MASAKPKTLGLCSNTSGLSHFMKLEERKDVLFDDTLEDPLGPDSFDNFEWVDVKQEIRDDVHVDKVTLTDLPFMNHDNATQDNSPGILSDTPVDESALKSISKNQESEDELWDQDSPAEESCTEVEDIEISSVQEKRKNKPKNCGVCGKNLSSMGSLRLHMLKKHKQKMQFTCDLCELKFDLQRELVHHRNTDHKKEDGHFHCDVCGMKFLAYHSLLLHIKSHLNRCKEEERSDIVCKECGKSFKDDESLKIHKQLVHGDAGTNLKIRLKSHEQQKNFVCDTCGKQFAFNCLLRDHINLHTGSKPYLCQSCGKSFAQKATLKQHTKTHSEVRPFQCPHCPTGFYGKGDLKKHLRKHTGERPYVCEVCGEGFSRGTHLSVHRRSHTGERPYLCDVCGRGFTKQGDVVRHRRIHTGELPYLCQACGKAFRQSSQCANHIKSQHPDTPVLVARNPLPVHSQLFS